MKFNVALLQILPHDSQSENSQKGMEYCRRAKEMDADLVLFPEMWNIGYAACPFDEKGKREWESRAIGQESDFFQAHAQLAKELEMNIAVTYLERHSPKPKNSVSIIDARGNVALTYSKVFICNFGLDELHKEHPRRDDIGCDYNCSPGSEFPVCTLAGKEGDVSVGAMICADREFPEAATQLMLKGAELIMVPNSCLWTPILTDTLKTRAFENQAGIAMANYPAPKDNGNSRAYHPAAWDEQGNEQEMRIVETDEKEGIFLASFDMDQIRDFRKKEAWRLAYRKNWYS